jgi:hypothetical protein
VVSSTDTESVFPSSASAQVNAGTMFSALCKSWSRYEQRQQTDEAQWIAGLGEYLEHIVNLRVNHVRKWIAENTARFKADMRSSLDPLRRELDHSVADLRMASQLCAMKCAVCHLHCLQSRDHVGPHDCTTTHKCITHCKYTSEHAVAEDCGLA